MTTIQAELFDSIAEVNELPFNEAAYAASIEMAGTSERFSAADSIELSDRADVPAELVKAAEDLSFSIFDAVDAGIANDTCGISINYSTGKDSTLVLSLYVRWMLARRAAGRTLRPVVVAIADTGSEFPDMARRIEDEEYWLRQFAEEKGLPIEVFVERPPLKNYLLAEVLGNGKPLPRVTRGGSGAQASEWCMDRVKGTPLGAIQKRLSGRFPFYVAMLGVRSDESNRRKSIISEYAGGLPEGLSRLGDRTDAIGCIPVVHWNKVLLRHFLLAAINDESLIPWRPNGEGARELNRIYRDAAGPGNPNNPFECTLTIAKDGSLSNSCSDLSGTRMGCWMCLLSKNKSLINLSKSRPKYVWMRKFHNYLYNHHRRNFRRAKLRNAAGFTQDTLFPKGFTFRERYFMTMILMRAEIESGEKLLAPDLYPVIHDMWAKYGISGITIEDARKDATLWKKTGKPAMCFDSDPHLAGDLAESLGLSLPAGAFWEPSAESGLKVRLELIHLLAMATGNSGDPILPVMRAHVFAPADGGDKTLVMVTDTPSAFGTRTNTGLLNGLCGAGWILSGTRDLTALERMLSDGRTYFYQTSPEQFEASMVKANKRGVLDQFYGATISPERAAMCASIAHPQIVYENNRVRSSGCPDDPLVYDWRRQESMQEMAGKMTAADMRDLMASVVQAVEIADNLEYVAESLSAETLARARANAPLLAEASPEGSAFRAGIRKEASAALNMDALRPIFKAYQESARHIAALIREQKASIGLISKLAYIVRMDAVDPEEAAKDLDSVIKQLKIAA